MAGLVHEVPAGVLAVWESNNCYVHTYLSLGRLDPGEGSAKHQVVSYRKLELRWWSGCILDLVVRGDPGLAQRTAGNVVQETGHGSRNEKSRPWAEHLGVFP
jgi:hypothetical protein